VRIALTSRLSQRQIADDLGVGLQTLNKWGNAHRDTNVVSVLALSAKVISQDLTGP
jgi:transposase